MPKRGEVWDGEKFVPAIEIIGGSDITPEVWRAKDREMFARINRRYIAAGSPEDWLQMWLDSVQHGLDRDGSVFERTCRLPFQWLVVLEEELSELREEQDPHGADLA